MRITLPSGSSVTATFVTPDSKDQVVRFYKDKFGSEASVFDSSNSAMITVQKASRIRHGDGYPNASQVWRQDADHDHACDEQRSFLGGLRSRGFAGFWNVSRRPRRMKTQ